MPLRQSFGTGRAPAALRHNYRLKGVIFIADYEDLAWIAAHRCGFVLNRYSNKNLSAYLILHRATCDYVTKLKGNVAKGGHTERFAVGQCPFPK